jgi:hypothetical protein
MYSASGYPECIAMAGKARELSHRSPSLGFVGPAVIAARRLSIASKKRRKETMPASLSQRRNSGRRLDRINWNTQAVLAAMKRGQSLHLHLGRNGPIWHLSGGRTITPEVAKAVTANAHVIDVGDALAINGARSQTWRWVEI